MVVRMAGNDVFIVNLIVRCIGNGKRPAGTETQNKSAQLTGSHADIQPGKGLA